MSIAIDIFLFMDYAGSAFKSIHQEVRRGRQLTPNRGEKGPGGNTIGALSLGDG